MPAIQQAQPVPHAQLSRKRLRRIFRLRYEMLRRRNETSQCVAIMPAWNAEQVSPRQSPGTVQQTERHATPETPPAKVTLRHSLRWDVVMDDEVRQVNAPCAVGQ